MTPRRLTSLLLLLTVVAVAMLFSVGPIAAQSVSVTDVAVTSRPASGDTYRRGETIEVTVTFSHAVNVTGVPAVSLGHFIGIGRSSNNMSALYTAGSGSRALVFRYTVTAADLDLDGISLAHNPIVLTAGPGSGTVRDNAGSAADTSWLPSRWVRDIAGHKVDGRPDTTPPTVRYVAITSRPASGDTYRSGETIQVWVLFSEAVTVTGAPRMVLFMDRGTVMYPGYTSQRGSPNRLIFEVSLTGYNLNKTKLNGISIQGNALTYRRVAQSGTIRDAAGNDANRSIPSHLWIENAGGHKVDARPSDHTALVALYNATNGPNWANNTNWLSNRPLGEWHGVSTNNSGRVTELDLEGNQLRGAIPPELGSLSNLEILSLCDNQLRGAIPAELGSLSNLGGLYLYDNQLSGSIPPELGSLSNLEALLLSGNQLSGSIPAELGNLSNLVVLYLYDNQLSGSIPPELGSLSNLAALLLNGNRLSGSIPARLGSLVNLQWLILSGNGFAGPLPSGLTQLTALENFAFGNNNGLCAPTDQVFQAWLQGIANGDLPHASLPGVTPLGPNCVSPDRAALVALYNATNGVNWSNKTNWLSNRPLGEWHGVVTNADGRVTELSFYNNQLSGSIPPELGSLSNLRGLYLARDRLSGSIPPELGRLSNLRELWLSGNQLSGSIPPALGSLSNLEILWIYDNQLSGSIPAELGSLSNLRELALDDNRLSGSIPAELGSLSNLESLILSGNQLSGSIPAELGSLSNLRFLYLYDNQLTGALPSGLTQLTALENFAFGNNSGGLCAPTDQVFQAWLQGIANSNLRHGVTPLGPNCADASPDRAALVALYNATNGGNWSNKTNWLSNRPLGEWHGVTTDNSGRVSWLDLNGNQLSGQIPPELRSLSNLEFLALYDNQLSGSIPAWLGSLSNLRSLSLSDNQLSGSIPPELGSLSNLRYLLLNSNRLSGSIPPELGSLSNLERLSLYDNQLSGSIPPELGSLSNLRYLYLDGNRLSGSIPAELGSLSNLQRLYLYDNQLTGALPSGLTQLTALENFAFGNNSGGLCAPTDQVFQAWLQGIANSNLRHGVTPLGPNCADASPDRAALVALYNATNGGNWSNKTNWLSNRPLGEWHGVSTDNSGRVSWLDLNGNQLSGQIPPELRSLSNLEFLALYDNQLSGSIPAWLGSLSNLEILALYGNQLSGQIPPELRSLSNLEVLRLHNNQLSGSIPAELGSLSNLEILALYGNQLSGSIPSELGSLSNLRSLWLDGNQLSGSIPPELGSLSNLRSLWLNGNRLTGSIPARLGSLVKLEWLILSRNGFAGTLPSGLTQLTALENFAFGNNSGGLCAPTDQVFQAWLQGIANGDLPHASLPGVTPLGPNCAAAVGTATRSFSRALVGLGGEVVVTLAVGGYGAFGQVVETLPEGFSYVSSSLTQPQNQVGRQITFTLLGETSFTYTVAARRIAGSYSFSGVLLNSDRAEVAVGGAVVITVGDIVTVDISYAAGSGDVNVRLNAPVSLSVSFSKPVTGFTVKDIEVVNGIAGNLSGAGPTYAFEVTPNAVGVVTVDIAAGVAEDSDSKGNTAAVQLTLGLPYDDDHDGAISREEVITAIGDYLFGGLLTRGEVIQIIGLYLFG